jgi:hypothetical protein
VFGWCDIGLAVRSWEKSAQNGHEIVFVSLLKRDLPARNTSSS